jgi:hypothetical protein
MKIRNYFKTQNLNNINLIYFSEIKLIKIMIKVSQINNKVKKTQIAIN